MVNSPRAGSLDDPCAISGDENNPAAPSAAAPPMK
jgi:hypothetical protein